MAQPTEYQRLYNFSNYQASNPVDPLPAPQLDGELNRVKLTTDQIRANLAKIQRDDGALKNGIVTSDSLSADVLQDFEDIEDAASAAAASAAASSLSASASASAASSSASSALASKEAAEDAAATAHAVSFSGLAGAGINVEPDPNTGARLHFNNINHQPVQFPGVVGSVGTGVIFVENTRTGGYGSYGDILVSNVVTAPTVDAEFDVAASLWITSTNLTGGTVFAMWPGANSPAREYDTWTSGAAVGMEINSGNRWADEGIKLDVGSGRYTIGLSIVPDNVPSRSTAVYVVTISVASPAVITRANHGLPAGTPIRFYSSGTLPTGMTAGTVYYVSATGLTTNSFQLDTALVGGSAVNTSGAGTGTLYYIPTFPGNFGLAITHSIGGARWWIGTFIRGNTIKHTGYGVYAVGGTVSSADQPNAYAKIMGYWKYGIDFQGSHISDGVFNVDFASNIATTATAGGLSSPGGYAGYLKFAVSGVPCKIPYFLD